MKKDYYKEVVTEIKQLIKIDPEKAYKKLEEELNMPYIPEIYEAQFSELLNDLRSELLGNTNVNNELSKDEVLEILKTNDSLKTAMALTKLKDLNIKSFIQDISFILKSKDTPDIVKTVIYEYCVEQEIDFKFTWNNIEVNPKAIGSTIELPIYQKAFSFIEENINQNPSLKELAFKYLELYALKQFPKIIKEKIELGPILSKIAHEALGIACDFKINETDLNKVKKIIAK